MKIMPDAYKVPEKIVSATIHFLYGISEKGSKNLLEFMTEKKFALTADLLQYGFTPQQIEEAVNSSRLKVVPWPKNQRKTDFYWLNDISALAELEKLAADATKFCYGQDKSNKPIGGDLASVGAEMGSQQLAIVGLIYAREQGRVVELEDFDRGAGPLYVNSDSVFAKVLLK
jgi:hypothetical protein